jgi:beta-phosphoglucomutase-like phosphatase (HAD superfamily)
MVYKAALFDMDGTLVNLDGYAKIIVPRFLKVFSDLSGRELPYDSIRDLHKPFESSFDEAVSLLREKGIDDYRKLCDAYCKADIETRLPMIGKGIRENPHSKELLAELKEDDIHVGVVTDSPLCITLYQLCKLGLMKYIDYIVSRKYIHPEAKNSPKGIFEALNFFDVHVGDACFVGDGKTDYDASRTAGIRFGLLEGGAFPPPDLDEDYPIARGPDLMEVWRGLNEMQMR